MLRRLLVVVIVVVRNKLLDIAGMDISLLKRGIVDDLQIQGNGRFYWLDGELLKSFFQNANGPVSRLVEPDELGHERVIINRQLVSLIEVRVQPDAVAAGRAVFLDDAR